MVVRRRRRDSATGVVIVSASCCIRGMEAFDEQAERIVREAATKSGVPVRVEVLPVTKAMFGGLPRKVIDELMARANAGEMPVPAVLVDGVVVSYGVPTLEKMESALMERAVD